SGVIQSRRVRALLSSRAERETPAAEGGRFPAAPGTVGGDAGSSVFDVFVGRDVDADALEARASEDCAELARAASASASSSGPPSAARVFPLPVGVTSSPDSPRRQRRQASRWKGAAFQPWAANQSASGASKRVRGASDF